MLARIRALQHRFGEARILLEEASRSAEAGADENTRLEMLRAEGLVLAAEGDAVAATQPLELALRSARRLGRSNNERNELHEALVLALVDAGRVKDAERALDEWVTTLGSEESMPFNPPAARAVATLMLARGDTRGASQMLEQVLASWPDPEHPRREVLEQLLAQAWTAQQRYREAERLLRGAIERVECLNRPTAYLRHEHGRALFGLGRLREAEQDFLNALKEMPESENAASVRNELAHCLAAQGRLDEAEALIDARLAELRRDDIAGESRYAIALFAKAHFHHLRGDLTVAGDLFRKVLRVEESTFGREHSTLVSTLLQLGDTLIELGKSHEAEPVLRRAVRLAERAGARLNLAVTLGALARAQAVQGFPHARDTARRALAAWDEVDGEPSPALRRELEAIAAGTASRFPAPSRRPR